MAEYMDKDYRGCDGSINEDEPAASLATHRKIAAYHPTRPGARATITESINEGKRFIYHNNPWPESVREPDADARAGGAVVMPARGNQAWRMPSLCTTKEASAARWRLAMGGPVEIGDGRRAAAAESLRPHAVSPRRKVDIGELN